MRNKIDAAYIANSVRMLRQVRRKSTMLLVEGDTDAVLLDRYIDQNKCVVSNAYGKENVLDAILELERDGLSGICGLVDSDYDSILGHRSRSANIIASKHHDLDLMLFFSAALELYLLHYSDKDKVKKTNKSIKGGIRALVLASARVFGSTRFVSHRDGLNLVFRNLDYHKLVDTRTLAVSEDWWQYVIDRSPVNMAADVLKSRVEIILKGEQANEHICQGHDVAAILGLALRSIIGDRKEPQSYGSEVEKGLRVAFAREMFAKCDVCDSILKWEERNASFIILHAAVRAMAREEF